MQPPLDLVEVRLVVRCEDAVADEEVQHDQRAVRLEAAPGELGLALLDSPEVELLHLAVVGLGGYALGEGDVVDVLA